PQLLDPPPFFGQLLGNISSMEAFVRDRYDSINFRDPGPGFPNSSGKGQFVAAYVHDFRYPLATNSCELGNWVNAVQFVHWVAKSGPRRAQSWKFGNQGVSK